MSFRFCVAAGLVVLLSTMGCKGKKDDDAADRPAADSAHTASPRPAGTAASQPTGNITISPTAQGSGATIEYDPVTGKSKVVGAPPLTGDPKDCAAFRACCTGPDMGLMCGLLEAQGGSCKVALTDARAMIKERNIKPPAGCL